MDISPSNTGTAAAQARTPVRKGRAAASARLDKQLAGDVESLIDKVIEIGRLEGEVAGLKAAIGPLARGGIRTPRAEVKYRGARVMDCFSKTMLREALVSRHGMQPGEADRLLTASIEGRMSPPCVMVKLRRGK